MFDVGWTELVVIAMVAILVVGPKDLPSMLRAFGKTVSQLRRMAGDFQKQFDDALKEAELDDVKKIASSKNFQPLEDARKSMMNFQKDVNKSVKELEAMPDAALDAKPDAALAETPTVTSAPASQPKPAEAKLQRSDASVTEKPARKQASKPASPRKKATVKAFSPEKAGAQGGSRWNESMSKEDDAYRFADRASDRTSSAAVLFGSGNLRFATLLCFANPDLLNIPVVSNMPPAQTPI
ncbi:MAG: Sec-independent protein translocase protein TatB [Nitratireductor sp.]